MSILMDALKRQQQHTIAAPTNNSRSPFWLGLLVGMLVLSIALLVGYWLGLQHQATGSAAKPPASEASQQQILAALTVEPDVLAVAKPVAEPEAAGADDELNSTQAIAEVRTEAKIEVSATGTPQEPAARQDEPQQVVTAERPARASMPSLSDIDEQDVTSELQERFSQAMDATNQQGTPRQSVQMHNAPAADISTLDEHTQRQLPALRFEAHVYASTPAQRWVKVNGRTLQQGQWLSTDVQIVEILPNFVLLRFRQQEFSVAALTEWSY